MNDKTLKITQKYGKYVISQFKNYYGVSMLFKKISSQNKNSSWTKKEQLLLK